MRDTLADAGLAAVRQKHWERARVLLTRAMAEDPSCASAPVLEGLADALWWCGEVTGALVAREQAVARWRDGGEHDRAVRAAVWIAIEYADALGNEAASSGWYARASAMASRSGTQRSLGWRALGQAALASDVVVQADRAQESLDLAREVGDPELEVLALARLGSARITGGSIQAGIEALDEAMATATAADFEHPGALGDLCCQLARATEAVGEQARFAEWLAVVRRVNSEDGHPPLAAYCATCCAELHTADGNWRAAEEHLRHGLDRVRGTGHRARCGPPLAKLAELLVMQGRLEEAADVLGDEATDSTLVARAHLALARGHTDAARTLAERWIRRNGVGLRSVGALSVVARAAVDERDATAAADAIARIRAVAATSQSARVNGLAEVLEGEAALAAGDHAAAAASFEHALDHYAGLEGLLDAARAHLGLAQASAMHRPDIARTEAAAALAGFESAGASRLADSARALLRAFGDRTHVGRKGAGPLTDREVEILRLMARGLTNAEIADRLYISTKTAGNHVSNILAKIGARSRTEAAAFVAARPELLSSTG